LLKKLASDLTLKLGRGFSERNLEQMRRFFLTWSIPQTASSKFLPAPAGASTIPQTSSATLPAAAPLGGLPAFPLPWSHYVRLLGVANPEARQFYEAEALRGGWTVRQLDRKIKLGKFTHADAGQMHLYLNYAREHWTLAGENPPVGLILCAEN
jgi:hypothetical protein